MNHSGMETVQANPAGSQTSTLRENHNRMQFVNILLGPLRKNHSGMETPLLFSNGNPLNLVA